MGPWQESPKRKTNGRRMGLKIAALALSCALLGGAAGAGVTAAVKSHGSGAATINVSDRTASQVVLKSVDGKTELTDAENYAANVNSVVSINVTGRSPSISSACFEKIVIPLARSSSKLSRNVS